MGSDNLRQHQSEKTMWNLPDKAPGLSQTDFNIAYGKERGNARQICGRAKTFRISGVSVICCSFKMILGVFHVYCIFSLHSGVDEMRKFPKLPLLWDQAIEHSLGFCFQILPSAWKGPTIKQSSRPPYHTTDRETICACTLWLSFLWRLFSSRELQ